MNTKKLINKCLGKNYVFTSPYSGINTTTMNTPTVTAQQNMYAKPKEKVVYKKPVMKKVNITQKHLTMDFFGKNNVANWHGNIEKQTVQNNNYRKVVETGKHAQLVFMSLLPKQEIGNEVHKHVDQFFRIEKGNANFVLNNGKTKYTEGNGGAVFVPANTWHNVINKSPSEKLKLYTIYSPPNHPAGLIQKDRPAKDMAYFESPEELNKIQRKINEKEANYLNIRNKNKELEKQGKKSNSYNEHNELVKKYAYNEALEDLGLKENGNLNFKKIIKK